jgi:hypothetical protein
MRAAAIPAALLGLFLLATSAEARKWDHPNSGACKSGTSVADIKNCKENGGTK